MSALRHQLIEELPALDGGHDELHHGVGSLIDRRTGGYAEALDHTGRHVRGRVQCVHENA